MKTFIGALTALLLLGGVLALPAAAVAPTVTEGVEVFSIGPEATSTVSRTANGMNVHLAAEGLEPGHVYSMWWVIFADVVKVDGECAPGNIFVLNATGAVANNQGEGTFAGRLSTGPIGPANGMDILENIGADSSFDDPLLSHVLNILVDHGHKHDLMAGTTVAQNMHTITGGAPDDALVHDNLPADLAAFCGGD